MEVAVHNEDPVGGGLERRGQHGVRFVELGHRGDAIGDVVPGRDESLDGRVVEQVGERERERDRGTRRVPEADVDGDRRRCETGLGVLHIMQRVA